MGQKSLVRLLFVLAVLAGVAFILNLVNRTDSGGDTGGRTSERVLPDFALNEVAQVRIKTGSGELNIKAGDKGWTVAEREGFPADVTKVIGLIKKVWDLKPIQTQPGGSTLTERFSLVDPSKAADAPGKTATVLSFLSKDGKEVGALWLGKTYDRKENQPSPFGGGMSTTPVGRYVKAPGSEDICLVNARDDTFAFPGGGKGHTGDTLDLAGAVYHGVDRDLLAVLLANFLGAAEVETASEFPDTEDVEASGDAFLFDRRSMGQGGIADGRSEIGEKSEMLAQREQGGAFRLFLRGEGFPFGASDGAEEDRVSRFTGRQGVCRQGVARGINRRATHKAFLAGQGQPRTGCDRFEDLVGLGHDFRADAVTREDGDVQGLGVGGGIGRHGGAWRRKVRGWVSERRIVHR